MIKHIVSFKLKDESKNKTNLIKELLETLPSKISEIKYFEVGINISDSPTAFDIVLISEFESIDSLKKYQVNPEHLKVTEVISLYKTSSMVVDYQF